MEWTMEILNNAPEGAIIKESGPNPGYLRIIKLGGDWHEAYYAQPDSDEINDGPYDWDINGVIDYLRHYGERFIPSWEIVSTIDILLEVTNE